MDDAVRVVVFTGSGAAFSAGDDISGKPVAGDPPGQVPDILGGHHDGLGTYSGLRYISQPLNSAVRGLNKLTIAAINGVAIQTGFSLALCCDFRIAASSARMGSATLRFGLLPDEGGQYLLVQQLGLPGALDFLMRKRIVDAERARELGLVHEVVQLEELDAHTMALAVELAQGPQVAMRLLKRSLYNAVDSTWEQALDEIASKTPMADHHEDAREGVAAFREKRAPRFNRSLAALAEALEGEGHE
jgi:2-(1,2-epoxy-1,2-dihydrophenyl)acetyl-CoA isomerase